MLNTPALEQTVERCQVAIEHAILCARVAEDNKGRDILVLDMRGITPLYDFFVLATGSSRRQIHTIAEEIDAALAAEGEQRCPLRATRPAAGWCRITATSWSTCSTRKRAGYYALEDLWADAPRIDWQRG